MTLETPRLDLIPASPAHLLALIEAPGSFEEESGLRPSDSLRSFFVSDEVSPDWLATLRASEGPDPWRHGFFVAFRESGLLIGSAGFKGPPSDEGVAEIAYGIVPELEGRGLATEVAAALVAFASGDPRVRLVRAHTLPNAGASARVLFKCGFRHVATVEDPVDGTVWRWERGVGGS